MSKYEWFLAASWVVFLSLLGPWLISAASNIAVGLGVIIAIALIVASVKQLKVRFE